MASVNWDDIFTLLAVTIVADKRIYKEEVESFTAQIAHLNSVVPAGNRLALNTALEWFKRHHKEIAEKTHNPKADLYITRLIKRLANSSLHSELLGAMYAVSLSDSDFHVQERSLMDLAAGLWGVRALR